VVGLRKSTSLVPALICLVGALWPGGADAQNPRDLYRDALEAVESQDWQTAIALLRQAIDENPEAKVGAFRRYVPHYYLGLSLFQLGNCRSALAVWEESEKQGAITRLKEYTELQQGRLICQKRTTRMEATNDLTEVAGLAADLGEVRDQPEMVEYWKQGSPSWNDRFDAARELLSTARMALERQDNLVTLTELEEARGEIAAAADQLAEIQKQAQVQFKNIQAKREVRSRLIEMVVEEAKQLLTSTAYLNPFPARLGALRQSVEELISRASASSDGESPEGLDDLRLELSRAVERLRQASLAPPQRLLDAAQAFFAGDHERVLALLNQDEFKSGRAAAHGHLLRAAALYSLWIEGGRQDELLGVEARNAVRSCREEDIELVPSTRAFSPRFIDFFFGEGQVRAPIPLE